MTVAVASKIIEAPVLREMGLVRKGMDVQNPAGDTEIHHLALETCGGRRLFLGVQLAWPKPDAARC